MFNPYGYFACMYTRILQQRILFFKELTICKFVPLYLCAEGPAVLQSKIENSDRCITGIGCNMDVEWMSSVWKEPHKHKR